MDFIDSLVQVIFEVKFLTETSVGFRDVWANMGNSMFNSRKWGGGMEILKLKFGISSSQ